MRRGRIQNELAVARAHSAGLKRVISLPAGTRSDDTKQQVFIEAIHRDPEVQFNAEVITAGVEAVKTAVLTALAPRAPALWPRSPMARRRSSAVRRKDRKDEGLLQLRKCLRARGLTLSKPAFDGDAEEVRRTHEGHLDECDAVLIYYGRGTDAWKQSIDRDLEKAKGRRGRAQTARGVQLDRSADQRR